MAGQITIGVGALEHFGGDVEPAPCDTLDVCSQTSKTAIVIIRRSRADRTAPHFAYPSAAKAAQEWADKEHRGAKTRRQILGQAMFNDSRSVNYRHSFFRVIIDLGPKLAQYFHCN